MEKWKQEIVAGNQAFREGHLDEAKTRYQTACDRAVSLLPHWSDAETAVTATVVSFQNLADLYFQQSAYQDAFATYKLLNRYLSSYQTSNACCPHKISIIDCAGRQIGSDLMHTIKRLEIPPSTAGDVLNDFFHLSLFSTQFAHKDQLQ